MHILLLILILGPVALIALRLMLAAAHVAISLIGFLIFIAVVMAFGGTNYSTPTSKSDAPIVRATKEGAPVNRCADIEAMLTDPMRSDDLCQRYHQQGQCQAEIEAGFDLSRRRLLPVEQCGTNLPPPPPPEPQPETLDSQATGFLRSLPETERTEWFVKMHDGIDPEIASNLKFDEVRNKPNMAAFLAFAKPSGDELQTLTTGKRPTSGAVTLNTVPTIAPFSGIVRGVYAKDPRHECSTRLRDHSLCIQRDGAVKCNVFAWKVDGREQVCVDYLIR
jgi:hypothetical protein